MRFSQYVESNFFTLNRSVSGKAISVLMFDLIGGLEAAEARCKPVRVDGIVRCHLPHGAPTLEKDRGTTRAHQEWHTNIGLPQHLRGQ